MEKLDFKAALQAMKAKKAEKSENEQKFTRKADLIKQKLEENSKTVQKGVFRNFEVELDEERDKWVRIRNNQLNKEREKHVDNTQVNTDINPGKNIDSKIETTTNQDPSELLPDKFEVKINPKEFKITIDPKKLIEEKKEQNEVKREINVNNLSNEYKCQELYNWFHLMFQAWEKELDNLPLEEKLNAEGKEKLGIYRQCRGHMKPLLSILKRNEVSKEIMNKLFEVMVYCEDQDFIRAHDKYIELAIGNAPWPMGVTMVGIHERSGRSRIYTSQVAHILNDENTKKYLQAVKRIMSLVQRIHKPSPSNRVVS